MIPKSQVASDCPCGRARREINGPGRPGGDRGPGGPGGDKGPRPGGDKGGNRPERPPVEKGEK